MRNYTQTNGIETYTTFNRLDIQIQSATTAKAIFYEQEVVELPDSREFKTPSGTCEADLSIEGDIIQIDIATSQPTGKIFPKALLFSLVYSVYFEEATKRDEKVKQEKLEEEARRLTENTIISK
jgi:hypothetical protein